MKLIIAGTRTINKLPFVVEDFLTDHRTAITEVVCGCAKGIDEAGRQWAWDERVPVRSFPADWVQYGKKAGPFRNQDMADYADALLLVWDGKSKGSYDMLNRALEGGLDVWEFCIAVRKLA
jgi:hypothetical protein